ncbi:hypothetical protein F5148DRAFT_1289564 [Russula earlei]|uniref:Uncharacterized protein n=1 Tax=Russula earlei TaxID=71964 RepID=A0ACC0TY82_9AGAM|nr:hypothetical protein F5148DRAFT_1289564 [Russula earlei]
MLSHLPPELVYQVALHLPLTGDVLALSLTNSRFHEALSTPALFKARLALHGWDVTAWHDGQPFKRWMRIDHAYSKTAQLFEEAAVEAHVLFFSSSIPLDIVWGRVSRARLHAHIDPSPDSRPVIDGETTLNWLRKLSDVLPMFITHHRGGNISRITQPRHHNALWAYNGVVADLCTITTSTSPDRVPVLPSEYDRFERVCFSLIALLMQSDANTVLSIFDSLRVDVGYPSLAFHQAFWRTENNQPADPDPASGSDVATTAVRGELLRRPIAERHFASFFIQSAMFIRLHLDAARARLALLAPSLPFIDPASCYDEPFELGVPPSPRPWLRDGLAGTPLAELSTTTGHPWAGYYIVMYETGRDPPMFLELRAAEALPDVEREPERMYFRGEGHDGVGSFTVQGACNTRTGTVDAIKAYTTHEWVWRGVITPFGLVGVWGRSGWSGGWWWIWPREWSPASGT